MARKTSLVDFESCVEQQVRSAQERGDFDSLPGAGKPLELVANPYAPDQELAFKVLKDAGYAPDWIELDKAVRSRRATARATLARARACREERLRELDGQSDVPGLDERDRAMAGWRRAVAAFMEEVTAINMDISTLNLKVPGPRFQRPMLDAGCEVEQIEMGSE